MAEADRAGAPTMLAFRRVHPAAALPMLPYLARVGYATALDIAICA